MNANAFIIFYLNPPADRAIKPYTLLWYHKERRGTGWNRAYIISYYSETRNGRVRVFQMQQNGSGFVTEAAFSGAYCECWESRAAAFRREMPARAPRSCYAETRNGRVCIFQMKQNVGAVETGSHKKEESASRMLFWNGDFLIAHVLQAKRLSLPKANWSPQARQALERWGSFALCGERPEALPLDSANF